MIRPEGLRGCGKCVSRPTPAAIPVLPSRTVMPSSIRIANAGGYWGDDLRQFKRQIERGPVDFVTLDFLAEVTMSIMQKQRARDPRTGYARDFVQMVEEALPAMMRQGTRAISNAGGVNPLACRAAIIEMAHQHGHDIEVAAIAGDDLMARLGELNAKGVALDNMDDGAPFAAIRDRVSSANAYYGAWPVVEALDSGARIVVTGRCTDTGITLAPMIHAFGWAPDDWDRLAAGIVAGHIVECGAQSTGGNFSDWRRVPRFHDIGYPVLEVFPDGTFVVTKHAGTGGRVTLRTVKEQLVYEMGDPRSYITPDVVADFASARLEQAGRDRVRVWGIKGRPAPTSLKVSASYFDGWKAAGTLILSGPEAVDKARAFADLFWKRLGIEFAETRSELIGHSACWGPLAPPSDPPEILLRLAVRDPDKSKIGEFSKMLPAVILSGPPGVAVTGGRPPAQEVVAYWPALVPRDHVKPILVTKNGERTLEWPTPARPPVKPTPLPRERWPVPAATGGRRMVTRMVTVPMSKLVHARSGDKGDTCNIGVIARAPEIYPWMRRALSAAIVKRHFRGICRGRVERHEVPNLWALNFLLHECLGGGGTVSLRIDAQGKTLSHALLTLRVTVPRALVRAAERGDAADGSVAARERTGTTRTAARAKRAASKTAGRTKRT
jgi:Acyclic terpene utilisation family protein AtuA